MKPRPSELPSAAYDRFSVQYPLWRWCSWFVDDERWMPFIGLNSRIWIQHETHNQMKPKPATIIASHPKTRKHSQSILSTKSRESGNKSQHQTLPPDPTEYPLFSLQSTKETHNSPLPTRKELAKTRSGIRPRELVASQPFRTIRGETSRLFPDAFQLNTPENRIVFPNKLLER